MTCQAPRGTQGSSKAQRGLGGLLACPHLAPSSWVPLHISSSPAPSFSPRCYLLPVGLSPLHLSYSHTPPHHFCLVPSTASLLSPPPSWTKTPTCRVPKRATAPMPCPPDKQTPGSLLCLISSLLWGPSPPHPHFPLSTSSLGPPL